MELTPQILGKEQITPKIAGEWGNKYQNAF